MEPFDLPRPYAAILLAEATIVQDRMDHNDIVGQSEAEPLPAGLISCGEISRLLPALVILLTQAYPEFLDPHIFYTAVTEAMAGRNGFSPTLN
jgi:hypothetical protein